MDDLIQEERLLQFDDRVVERIVRRGSNCLVAILEPGIALPLIAEVSESGQPYLSIGAPYRLQLVECLEDN